MDDELIWLMALSIMEPKWQKLSHIPEEPKHQEIPALLTWFTWKLKFPKMMRMSKMEIISALPIWLFPICAIISIHPLKPKLKASVELFVINLYHSRSKNSKWTLLFWCWLSKCIVQNEYCKVHRLTSYFMWIEILSHLIPHPVWLGTT